MDVHERGSGDTPPGEFGCNQPSFNVGVFAGTVTAVLSPEVRVNNITGFEVRDNRRRKIPGSTTFSLIALHALKDAHRAKVR
jgi:hypothetical protein